MESFLHEVAERLLKKHGSDLSHVTVVFNNRRSGLFLREALAEAGPDVFFLPKTIGMDDLVKELCALDITQKEYLLFDLYDVHRTLTPGENKFNSFDEFISLGEIMLSDFSEIDLYHADAEKIFANTYDLKAIDEWNVGGAPPSEFQEQYLRFFRSLYSYYTCLRDKLQSQGKAYSGMAYRTAADNMVSGKASPEGDYYYFVGFNALSTCEKTIIETLYKEGRATVIADGDAYYFDSPEQESGRFLRELSSTFKEVGHFANHFAKEEKNITIVNCPDEIAQTKYAGELLRKLAIDGGSQAFDDTAVVLADENLIVPMLHSIPDNIDAVNITMGYPLTHTAIHTITLKLFALYEHIHNKKFHHKDVAELLSDPNIRALCGSHKSQGGKNIQETLYDRQLIYVDSSSLYSIGDELELNHDTLAFVFDPDIITSHQFVGMATHLARLIESKALFSKNRKENEGLTCFMSLMEHFAELQSRYDFVDNLETFERIYTRMAQRLSIPFRGEPLRGLQILGMLETRNLDFKRVILLSANEGILPSGKKPNSLITYNIKKHFGLPTHEEKDAVYANHFYCMMQRAEEIYITYSSQAELMGKGEPSRFVLQLRDELAKQNNNIKLHSIVVAADTKRSEADAATSADEIIKTDEIMNRLQRIAESGFSPTALNTYRSCPKKYFYENVLNIHAADAMEDTLDESHFGTIVHEVLCDIYSKAKDGILTKAFLDEQLRSVEKNVSERFLKLGEEFFAQGRTVLFRSIAQKAIEHLIKHDIQDIEAGRKIKILLLEKQMNCDVPEKLCTNGAIPKLQGTADRIDMYDGHVRIVDYKTGRVKESDLKNSSATISDGAIKDKSFQVLMYAWLYLHDKSIHKEVAATDITANPIESGIYPLVAINSAFLPVEWDKERLLTLSQIENFGSQIEKLVAEIMDPGIPFRKMPSSKDSCAYCVVKAVCQGKV